MKESGLCLEKTTDIIEKEGILDIKDNNNIGNKNIKSRKVEKI